MADSAFLLTVAELAAATSGRIVRSPAASRGPDESGFSSVRIDSRAVEGGALFVALIGSERDGHLFIPAALASGASVALAAESRADAAEAALAGLDAYLVVVADTLAALQAAARAYIDKFPSLLRVGITGSSGKTTTKELAAAMIGKEKKVVMNVGNLNSETGLPLSVFTVRAEHEVGVFELGMNRRGEIGELAAVLRPSIALVTNVGTAHIGILGSRDAIAEEKKAIFSRFTGSELALVPEDDEYSDALAYGVRGRVQPYGRRTLAKFDGSRPLGLDGTEIRWAGVPCVLPLPGEHNVRNALAAAAIAEAVGVSDASIRAAISTTAPLFGRAEILRGPITVVQDCYNANPESMEASLDFCDSVEWAGRRIYVIGSMLELGALSEQEHFKLGQRLAESEADLVFLFGAETAAAVRGLDGKKRFFRSEDFESFAREVTAAALQGDLVLLKGSRGTALERLTERLGVGCGPAPHG